MNDKIDKLAAELSERMMSTHENVHEMGRLTGMMQALGVVFNHVDDLDLLEWIYHKQHQVYDEYKRRFGGQ